MLRSTVQNRKVHNQIDQTQNANSTVNAKLDQAIQTGTEIIETCLPTKITTLSSASKEIFSGVAVTTLSALVE